MKWPDDVEHMLATAVRFLEAGDSYNTRNDLTQAVALAQAYGYR